MAQLVPFSTGNLNLNDEHWGNVRVVGVHFVHIVSFGEQLRPMIDPPPRAAVIAYC
jgi:hypothetical protein